MAMKHWLIPLAITSACALVIPLSIAAVTRDQENRLAGFYTCDDLNEDLSVPQFSRNRCLDGHQCVICVDTLLAIGEETCPTSQGPPKDAASSFNCFGTRLIGVCVGEPSYCDPSDAWVDGQCNQGMIHIHPDQIAPFSP